MTGTLPSSGSTDTGLWVTDGMQFFLVDLASGGTIASLTVRVTGGSTPKPTVTFTANPNPIILAAGVTTGQTTLNWNAPGYSNLVIRLNSPSGSPMTGALPSSGTTPTGNWVSSGMQFFLVDASTGNSLASVVVTATGGVTFTPANITSPTPLSTLTVPLVTFSWSGGASVSSYAVLIGTTPNGSDIHSEPALPPSATSLKWSIPIDGRFIYVTIYSFFGSGPPGISSAQYVTQAIDYAVLGTYTVPQGVDVHMESKAWCRANGPNSVAAKVAAIPQSQITITRSSDLTYNLSMRNVAGAGLPTYSYALPITQKTQDQIVFAPPNGSITTNQTYSYSTNPFAFPGIQIVRRFTGAGDAGFMEVTGVNGQNYLTFEGFLAASGPYCDAVFDDSVILDYTKPLQ
jgi:hypothetical protein